MKKNNALFLAALIALTSCGTGAQFSSSSQQYKDGIYYKPAVDKVAEAASQEEMDALVAETLSSELFLTDGQRDTIVIPKGKTASITYNKDNTVTYNFFDTDDLYWGYSWAWSPWYMRGWYGYRPWFDPWYYDPWYRSFTWGNPYSYWGYWGAWGPRYGWYSSYWDPWYYDPWYYDPWYYAYGPYYGWGGYYGYHHYHGWGGPRHGHLWHGAMDPAHGPRSGVTRISNQYSRADGLVGGMPGKASTATRAASRVTTASPGSRATTMSRRPTTTAVSRNSVSSVRGATSRTGSTATRNVGRATTSSRATSA